MGSTKHWTLTKVRGKTGIASQLKNRKGDRNRAVRVAKNRRQQETGQAKWKDGFNRTDIANSKQPRYHDGR